LNNNEYIEYKVSVSDVVNSNKKVNDDWGLEGYKIPKFNAHLDKSLAAKMTKSNEKTYLEMIQKQKAYIPAPS
jgi:hypothetical protein